MLVLMLAFSAAVAPQQAQQPIAKPLQQEEGIEAARDPGQRVTDYLAAAADSMHLTPAQRGRLTKIREWLSAVNSPVRDSLRAVTGGRTFRTMPPDERRQLAPRIRPLMAHLAANGRAALDSVDAVLTPQQQERLAQLRAEYRNRPHAGGGAHP